MFQIVDKKVFLDYPLGHHLHCMISQIPNDLRVIDNQVEEDAIAAKWALIKSVMNLVATRAGNLKKLHFLLFPEATLPTCHLDDALALIEQSFCTNTVTMLGMEHLRLSLFQGVVERFADDNQELLQSIVDDLDSADIADLHVNWAVIVVKEGSGRVRVFLQAKSHPFVGEESLDHRDLYHGKVFPLFRSYPTGFNFMAMICFDYIYRTIYQSNINTVIQHANELFFSTRQHLDFLAVLECNPKPEHDTFRDVINGFYGEYLAAAPGVRDTITAFCNSSGQTRDYLPHVSAEDTFGYSSVMIHKKYRMACEQLNDFKIDDFSGLPIRRLRFGCETRLYYFNLPVFYEFDLRSTRMPLKVHSIFESTAQGGWQLVNFSPNPASSSV
ncbi:MAG: hypothetical protein B6I36_05920 [Desulfobacteraceae bacterium 4572_35.1]|nr:MAG: hypothetical protein B6I36_05920 [Desulfobacteraceae bacterium 4572_35.1]